MYLSTQRFLKAFAAIDAANSTDPKKIVVEGKELPSELVYSRWMTETLEQYEPDAPESVYLAARAHHIRRWMIPRNSYANGRLGYLQWRTALSSFHAKQVAQIL